MIIGFTGKNAAGKGESANHLAQRHGFVYLSLSDELREEATKLGVPHTREELIALGTKLRSEHGTGYLAGKVNEKILNMRKKGKNRFVVDSIRGPGEVEELGKNKDFLLVGIDADAKLRFERMVRRGRKGDASSFEQFAAHEQRENQKSAAGQQLDKCLSMASEKVMNDGTLDELYEKIDRIAGVGHGKG